MTLDTGTISLTIEGLTVYIYNLYSQLLGNY